mgnify:CR=1 FL=1
MEESTVLKPVGSVYAFADTRHSKKNSRGEPQMRMCRNPTRSKEQDLQMVESEEIVYQGEGTMNWSQVEVSSPIQETDRDWAANHEVNVKPQGPKQCPKSKMK